MAPPLTCTTAWMNFGTGNIQLKMNRPITPKDQSKLRTALTALLESKGINFRTHTKDHCLLMQPTDHKIDPEEMKSLMPPILEDLGFGKDIKIKVKFVSADIFGAGLKSRVTILPYNYFSPQ